MSVAMDSHLNSAINLRGSPGKVPPIEKTVLPRQTHFAVRVKCDLGSGCFVCSGEKGPRRGSGLRWQSAVSSRDRPATVLFLGGTGSRSAWRGGRESLPLRMEECGLCRITGGETPFHCTCLSALCFRGEGGASWGEGCSDHPLGSPGSATGCNVGCRAGVPADPGVCGSRDPGEPGSTTKCKCEGQLSGFSLSQWP